MRGGRYAKCTYHSSDSTYDKLGRPRRRKLRYGTRLQSSQIRSARLEQQGEDGCLFASGSGRLEGRNALREHEPPRLRIWETCSGWGNRGSGSGMSCGVRNTGRLDLSAAGQLTNKKHRDRLVRKEEKPTPSKPLRLQQFNTPMWIPCPSPSLRPEQTAYAKEKPARCDARRSMQRRNIHISGASRRLRRHGSWARMPTWMCSLQQQVVRYRHA
jgi:hypothetical protein